MELLALYARLIGAQLRSQMQYKVSFFLALVGSFLACVTEFGVVVVLFLRVPALAGWSFAEVALLYGISGVCFAVAEIIAAALDNFQFQIVRGTFDRVLVRPRGALFQVIVEDFALRRVGRIGQAVVVLVIALRLLPIDWTPERALVLALALLSGTVIYFAIFVLGASFCFWSVQAKEATHVFTYGGDGLASYPLDIYRASVRRFFTFVVPLAFVNYEPALYLLGRSDPLGLPAGVRLLSPVAGVAMALVARFGWQQGVRHYQSTGT
ncbi:MAG: ABC-2 family transporter protein [Chloroflexota bacterium]|nr:ABC-2 family transporter protein [Chloroflexota bacterium]